MTSTWPTIITAILIWLVACIAFIAYVLHGVDRSLRADGRRFRP